MQSRWLILTIVAARAVSSLNFAENIAVIAAAGEASAMVIDTSIVPLILQAYIAKSAKSGNTTSFNREESIAPLSLRPLRISLFDR